MERNLKSICYPCFIHILSIYSLPALLTSLPRIPFTNEEITGCTNEAAKCAKKAQRNPPSCDISFHPKFHFVLSI